MFNKNEIYFFNLNALDGFTAMRADKPTLPITMEDGFGRVINN